MAKTQVDVGESCGSQMYFHIKKYMAELRDKFGRPRLNAKGEPEKRIQIVRTMYLHFPKEIGNSSGFWKCAYTKRRPRVRGWFGDPSRGHAGMIIYPGSPEAEYYEENKQWEWEWVPGPEVETYSISTIPVKIEKLERGNRYMESGTPQTRSSVPNTYKYSIAHPVLKDGEVVEDVQTIEDVLLDGEGKAVGYLNFDEEGNPKSGWFETTREEVRKPRMEREVVEDAQWFVGQKPTWTELVVWIGSKGPGDNGGFKKVEPYTKSLSRDQFIKFLAPRVGGLESAMACVENLENLPPEKWANEK